MEKEGNLKKYSVGTGMSGVFGKNWKPRFFKVTAEGTFAYWEKQANAHYNLTPKRTIELVKRGTPERRPTVIAAPTKAEFPHATNETFIVVFYEGTSALQLPLMASSQAERDEWVAVLSAHLALAVEPIGVAVRAKPPPSAPPPPRPTATAAAAAAPAEEEQPPSAQAQVTAQPPQPPPPTENSATTSTPNEQPAAAPQAQKSSNNRFGSLFGGGKKDSPASPPAATEAPQQAEQTTKPSDPAPKEQQPKSSNRLGSLFGKKEPQHADPNANSTPSEEGASSPKTAEPEKEEKKSWAASLSDKMKGAGGGLKKAGALINCVEFPFVKEMYTPAHDHHCICACHHPTLWLYYETEQVETVEEIQPPVAASGKVSASFSASGSATLPSGAAEKMGSLFSKSKEAASKANDMTGGAAQKLYEKELGKCAAEPLPIGTPINLPNGSIEKITPECDTIAKIGSRLKLQETELIDCNPVVKKMLFDKIKHRVEVANNIRLKAQNLCLLCLNYSGPCAICERGMKKWVSDQDCPTCDGHGHFDKFGKPTKEITGTFAFQSTPCHTCNGKLVIPADMNPCPTCEGKGWRDAWGRPIIRIQPTATLPCNTCIGSGVIYNPLLFDPFAAPDAQHEPEFHSCPICEGQGALDEKGKPTLITNLCSILSEDNSIDRDNASLRHPCWGVPGCLKGDVLGVMQGGRGMLCTPCNSVGMVQKTWTRCSKCNGSKIGILDIKNPTNVCDECLGSGGSAAYANRAPVFTWLDRYAVTGPQQKLPYDEAVLGPKKEEKKGLFSKFGSKK